MPDLRPRPGPPARRPPGAQEPAGPRVAGPMRRVVRYVRQPPGRTLPERDSVVPAEGCRFDDDRFGSDANALVMLNRIAVYQARDDGGPGVKLADGGRRALVRWACDQRLGQHPALVAAVARRRELALRTLDRTEGRRPCCHLRLTAEPEWRLVAGLGNRANAHEIGLSLHGTYGWPVIPGSSLKGLAAAWAGSAAAEAEPDDVTRVFGTASCAGTVRFLDAIPAGEPVTVAADVLTPHVKPYYDSLARRDGGAGSRGAGDRLIPPAEYHNPQPVVFLTVRGRYAVDLYGPSRSDLDVAAGWLRRAGDELGAGAKTAAGYGYLAVRAEAGGTAAR